MYKLAIADDEETICQLINALIDYQNIDVVLDRTLHDGNETIAYILENKPDIVIIDIRMPGADGLEIIRQVREAGFDTHFIIVTGHQFFDYAYYAIKYSVDDYLVKPVNKSELNAALNKICREIWIERAQGDQMHMVAALGKSKGDELSEQLLHDLLCDTCTDPDIKMLQQSFGEPALPLDAVALRLDPKTSLVMGNNTPLLLKLSALVKRLAAKQQISCVTVLFEGILYCVFEREPSKTYLQELFDSIAAEMDRFPDHSITGGVGRPAQAAGEIKQMLFSAKEALNSRIIEGTGRLIYFQPDILVNRTSAAFFDQKWQIELTIAISRYDEEKFSTIVRDALASISAHQQPASSKMQAYGQMLEITLKQLDEEENQRTQKIQRMQNCGSIEQIEQMVLLWCAQAFSAHVQRRQEQFAWPVKEAKAYIDMHYAERITLETVADKVFLNPIYLSNAFKKETGVNFSKYLLDCRLKAAKDFLVKTNYGIQEITELVGYQSQRHFSRVFKKEVGINPTEYRRLYQ